MGCALTDPSAALGERLRAAVEGECAREIAGLVAAGGEPDGRTPDGQTLLTLAISRGHGSPAVVAALLAAGADPDAPDARGWTPWMVCFLRRAEPEAAPVQAEIAALLAEAGASRKGEGAIELRWAARDGDLARARALLDAGVGPDEGPASQSPLAAAAAAGHGAIVRLLLERGAEVDRRQPGQLTPLIHAAYAGRLETVRVLAHAGASLEAEVEGVGDAIHYAELGGHAEVAAWLEGFRRSPSGA